MNDTNQGVNSTGPSSRASSNTMTTEEIKELIGIPSWVDNNIIEQAAADVFQNIISLVIFTFIFFISVPIINNKKK